jgi:serine/threonine protein kinase
MTLTPGTKLGPCEILARIGAGGMGEVWKARDTRLGRIVAIKKVKEQHSERFKQEASANPRVGSRDDKVQRKSEHGSDRLPSSFRVFFFCP